VSIIPNGGGEQRSRHKKSRGRNKVVIGKKKIGGNSYPPTGKKKIIKETYLNKGEGAERETVPQKRTLKTGLKEPRPYPNV